MPKTPLELLKDFIADADAAIAAITGAAAGPPPPTPPPPPVRVLTTGTAIDPSAISAWVCQIELLAKNELGVSHYYHWPITEAINKLDITPTLDNLKIVRQLLFACWQDCDLGRVPPPNDSSKKDASGKLFDAVIASTNLWLGIAAAIIGLFVLKTKVTLTFSWPLCAVAFAACSFIVGGMGYSWIIDALAKSSNLRLAVLGKGTRNLLLLQLFFLILSVLVVCGYWLNGNVILESASTPAGTVSTGDSPKTTVHGQDGTKKAAETHDHSSKAGSQAESSATTTGK